MDRTQFLAVGAHPSAASYNRLGQLLKGQGLVQIWAFDFSSIDQFTGNRHESGVSSGTSVGVSSTTTAGKRARSSSRDTNGEKGKGRCRGIRMAGPDVAVEFDGGSLLLDDAPTGHGVLSTITNDDVGDAYVVQRNGSPAIQTHPASSTCGKRQRKLKESARAKVSDPDLIETRFPRWYREEGPAKMVLGLEHDGLVTWDAKWRPVGEIKNLGTERELLRLGFVALLLGDGSIQV